MNHIVFTCSITRQVCALYNIPTPHDGIDEMSLYFKFQAPPNS